MRRPILFYYLLLLVPLAVRSQSMQVSGTVIDSASGLPVAFAGVSVRETNKGALTDIDGHFNLNNVPVNARLVISYTGYQLREISLNGNRGPLRIVITRKEEALEEVVVSSNMNPAHRIILLMQQNKQRNDPMYVRSYTYNSYTLAALGTGDYLWRMTARTAQPRRNALKRVTRMDSAERRAMSASAKALRENYLFVTETYSEKNTAIRGR
jgi:hypothetical protein